MSGWPSRQTNINAYARALHTTRAPKATGFTFCTRQRRALTLCTPVHTRSPQRTSSQTCGKSPPHSSQPTHSAECARVPDLAKTLCAQPKPVWHTNTHTHRERTTAAAFSHYNHARKRALVMLLWMVLLMMLKLLLL